jgi:hypothetical protein
MKRKLCSFAVAAVLAVSLLTPKCVADGSAAAIIKHEGYTVSLDLKFTLKKQSSLQHALSFLDWGPNGYATGFIVGDGLVLTAYHVVSGDLSSAKKVQLGFEPHDQLEVKVNINDCKATVLKVDEAADLALLRICPSPRQAKLPTFQMSIGKDEKLLLIARPHGTKMVKRGIFFGTYLFRGLQYLSANIEVRDGYSGSPVYNDKAELVGVFIGYDWAKKLALISPGERAQKLLEDYNASLKP